MIVLEPPLHRSSTPLIEACARSLLCEARADLARLRRIHGAGRRTARRIARAQALLACAGALLGLPLADPARASDPVFLNPLAPFGLADAGTFASPAFADLDGDGDLDAIVGEGDGNAIFFANTGTASAPAFAPPATNPFGLADVGYLARPALADLDGDGDLDAFVGEAFASTLFFENTGTASAPAFAPPETDPFGLAEVADLASPTFADLDDDGDLDSLVGENTGSTIYFENTGSAGAPAFAPPVTNPFGLAGAGSRATPAFADLDGDGDLDAFVGEELGNAISFENTGTASAPAFVSPVTNPFGLADVGYDSYPAFADLDGDGDLDAFVGEGTGTTLFFENTGTARAPLLAAPGTDGLGLGDVGDDASPTFADLDGDGDGDAFVGALDGNTYFFENTGAASEPGFALPVTNPFGLANVGAYASPAFADLDGDGDLDGFVGDIGGSTVFFENTGSVSAPAFAPPVSNPFGLADVEDTKAAPAFADIDGDGDLDGLIGEDDGNTVFFENTGTASAPAFAAATRNPFGLAKVVDAASPAFADVDGDGDLDAFVGEFYGNAIFFRNTGTARAPAFASAVTNPFELADAGTLSSPELADIDGDGDLDAFVGNEVGRTLFFRNRATACPGKPALACTAGFARGSLEVDERKQGKERLSAGLRRGPALTQTEFGDPLVAEGTAVALCVYDDAGARVAELEVDRAGGTCGARPCWKPIGKPPPAGKGFAYKDPKASSDGVRSFSLKAGVEDRSTLACSAGNRSGKGQTAFPAGIAAALVGTESVQLQVHTSEGACFSHTLVEITRQEDDRFEAR